MSASSSFVFLLPGLFLLTIGTARAQQPAAGGDSVPAVTIERVVYARPVNPMLTAADSARERLRVENARRLRQTGKNNPAHPLTPASGQLPTTPTDALAKPSKSTEPTPSELAKDARRREQAAREAAENEKKREKTLYKRAKKSS